LAGDKVVGPGQSTGDPSLFGAAPAPAAVAAEKTRVLRLDRADFEQVVEDNPAIALAICRVLARSPS
jgi:CRP-like cAMP-binding protein